MRRLPTSGDPLVPIVILNWNGEADTLDCLNSIKRGRPAGFIPVIVDNGSRSDGLEQLRRHCRELYERIWFLSGNDLPTTAAIPLQGPGPLTEDTLVFIENSENLGFAKGCNVGVRFAAALGSEWALLLNNDTRVAPDALQKLRNFTRAHPEFVAVTPQIRYFNAKGRVHNCGGQLTFFGSRRYRHEGAVAAELPRVTHAPITFVTGCALMFRHSVTGALTEQFFFGEEDYEFSLRLQQRGLSMACVYEAVVHHKIGTSVRKVSKPVGGILLQYVCRLLNTRNYYSRLRWNTTRLLAYLYLPVLYGRNGINPLRAFEGIAKVEARLKLRRGVDRAEFQSMIGSG
jgi:GT2 family glycosyltransferase